MFFKQIILYHGFLPKDTTTQKILLALVSSMDSWDMASSSCCTKAMENSCDPPQRISSFEGIDSHRLQWKYIMIKLYTSLHSIPSIGLKYVQSMIHEVHVPRTYAVYIYIHTHTFSDILNSHVNLPILPEPWFQVSQIWSSTRGDKPRPPSMSMAFPHPTTTVVNCGLVAGECWRSLIF